MTVESQLLQRHRAYRYGDDVIFQDTGRSMRWSDFLLMCGKMGHTLPMGDNVVMFPKRREDRPCDTE